MEQTEDISSSEMGNFGGSRQFQNTREASEDSPYTFVSLIEMFNSLFVACVPPPPKSKNKERKGWQLIFSTAIYFASEDCRV